MIVPASSEKAPYASMQMRRASSQLVKLVSSVNGATRS
jgi:hypothetical protein